MAAATARKAHAPSRARVKARTGPTARKSAASARRRSGAAPAKRASASKRPTSTRGIGITRAGAIALPRPGVVVRPRRKPVARPRTATPRAPGRFAPVADRVLRGPGYIALVGVLLAGIVFFNVDVLQVNHGIAATGARADTLKRENAVLTRELAKLASTERIQEAAAARGLVLPPPGDVRYLKARGDDSRRALRTMTAPEPTTAITPVPAPQPAAPEPAVTAPATTAPVAEQQTVTPPAATAQPAPAPVTPQQTQAHTHTQTPPAAAAGGGAQAAG